MTTSTLTMKLFSLQLYSRGRGMANKQCFYLITQGSRRSSALAEGSSHGSGRVTRLTYPHSAEAWRSYEWWATQAWLSFTQTPFETRWLTCRSFWCIDSFEFWSGLWVLCIFQIGVQIACAIKLILTKWWKSTSLKDSMVFEVTVVWAQQRKGECHKDEYRRIWNTSQNSWDLYSIAKIMKLVWLWLDHKAVGKDIQYE